MIYPKNMRGATEPWLHLPAAAGEYKAGQLVQIGTANYLCMADITLEEGQLLPVQSLRVDTEYVSTLASDAEDLAVGSRVTLSDDSTVAAESGGMFVVTWLEGTTAGSEVHFRFGIL